MRGRTRSWLLFAVVTAHGTSIQQQINDEFRRLARQGMEPLEGPLSNALLPSERGYVADHTNGAVDVAGCHPVRVIEADAANDPDQFREQEAAQSNRCWSHRPRESYGVFPGQSGGWSRGGVP